MSRRRQARRVAGIVPRLARLLWRGLRWALVHPQLLVMIAIPTGCVVACWVAVPHSDAFRITTIQLPAEGKLKAPASLIGQNLWTVDLDALAEHLHAQQPQLKQVRVIRQLPNTLQVEALQRLPIAQVWLSSSGGPRQWHAVDRDGFLLAEGHADAAENLLILKGVDSSDAPFKVGRQNTSQPLETALRLVERLRRSPALRGHTVTHLDVSDPHHLTFLMDEGMEIRCGSEEELDTHLDRLRAVLKKVAPHQLNVRYVDLRFHDPVIGPRT